MQYAGCVAISVTIVNATMTQNALTPLLVARSRAILLGGQGRRAKHRLIPPQCKQDATETARQCDDGDPLTPSAGETLDPGAQRGAPPTAPTGPGGLDEQTA